MAMKCSSQGCSSRTTWNCTGCNLPWCMGCVYWSEERQPLCEECRSLVVEDIDCREDDPTPAQTPEARRALARPIALRVFFCPKCQIFKAAVEEDEWPTCWPCNMACCECKVNIEKVLCNACDVWFDTPEALVSHMAATHQG